MLANGKTRAVRTLTKLTRLAIEPGEILTDVGTCVAEVVEAREDSVGSKTSVSEVNLFLPMIIWAA